MDVTETRADGLSRELTVTVPASDLEAALEQRLQKMAGGVKIPGFRPGKAPMPLLKKRYASSVMGEVLENAVNENSRRALNEREIRSVGKPSVEISDYEEGGDLSFTISLELFPEMPEFDLRKLQLTRYVVEVNDERIGKALEDVAQRHERFRPLSKPRKAKKGDLVIFDFTGYIDGEPFEGGSGQDERVVLGSGRYVKGYEEQMIGCEAGKKANVNVVFPLDYRAKNLAGKQAHFDLDIKEIQEADDVPVDEQLAKEMGHEDLNDLRKAVQESMARDFEHLSRLRLRRDMHDALLAHGDFDLPSRIVETEFARMWIKPGSQADDEKSKDLTGDRKEEDRDKTRAAAERRVRLGLMLAEIGRRNELSLSEQELSRAVENEARRYPGQEAQFVQHIRNHPEMLEQISNGAYEEKVVDFILEMAAISDQSAPLEQLIEVDLDAPLPESAKKVAEQTDVLVDALRDAVTGDEKEKGGKKSGSKAPKAKSASSKKSASKAEDDIVSENVSAAVTSKPPSAAKTTAAEPKTDKAKSRPKAKTKADEKSK